MKSSLFGVFAVLLGLGSAPRAEAAPSPIKPEHLPDSLKSWSAWALWDDTSGLQTIPGTYQDPKKKVALWPSTLQLAATQTGGTFAFRVEAFAQAWAPLLGSREMWPVRVLLDGKEAVVIEHDGSPAVLLQAGSHQITGEFVWQTTPQTLRIPSNTGVLSLTLEGQPVENATWDAQGILWLERRRPEQSGTPDYAELKVYRVLEDGSPLWLHTELELTVAGKSRELELGTLLPRDWSLASLEGPLPAAVDASGRLKVQARAGKWTLSADAFRTQPPSDFGFPADATPLATQEFVALKTAPAFRIIEFSGIAAVDVSQTTFPQKWRELPLFRWDTGKPFQIVERIRGMGNQRASGLSVTRQLWLDEDGRGLTFRDQISGPQQTLWRLDSVPEQQLGAVRSGAEGQLITKNPVTGDAGVEVRSRNVQLEATGRIENTRHLPATGWKADANSAHVTLHLPPGWRLLALFGADEVKGDWLTAWTLLDLFVVLVFSLGTARVFGWFTGLLAFCALLLSYREPEAPHYSWLFVLAALALVRVVGEGRGASVARALKTAAVVCLLLVLVPFVATQLQAALHPQLENSTQTEEGASMDFQGDTGPPKFKKQEAPRERHALSYDAKANAIASSRIAEPVSAATAKLSLNLAYDQSARIQTGPPVPDWKWRSASFGWNGPVTASQKVRLVLLPVGVVRFLAALRIGLLLALCAFLLEVRRWNFRLWRGSAAALLFFSGCFFSGAQANEPVQGPADPGPVAFHPVPDAQTLQLLRSRLSPESDAFPNAADIPSATLEIANDRITLEAEVHVAERTAVPLPGRFPAWSPIRVLVDGLPQVALRREDGFLWTVLTEGVHRIRVEGLLAGATEWEWTFQLKPRRVAIRAPGWEVSGVRANGVPEAQVFFRSKQAAAAAQGYDRQDFRAALLVERRLELGLTWQVHTTVKRLSPEGRAVSVRIPLLTGEKVLTASVQTADGMAEVRLGARDKSLSWSGELPVSEVLNLTSRGSDSWVEQWSLVASPVWNIGLDGVPPVYTPQEAKLVPHWNPWPGEQVALRVGRAEAVPGATVTVNSVQAETTLGLRQREERLSFSVRSSLGEEFSVQLPATAEVRSLSVDGKPIPVRLEAGRLQVPLHPGEQRVAVAWRSPQPLEARSNTAAVTLPVPCANVDAVLKVPDGRWVLWTHGPLLGPAVRLWSILAFSALAGVVLGRLKLSPLGIRGWILLNIGLTQAPFPATLAVAGWLLCIGYRARQPYAKAGPFYYNLLQLALLGWTIAALAILATAVSKGLLGQPETFLAGNGSSRLSLHWFQARSQGALPQAGCVHVSLWWHRLAMLLWALWLAGAVLDWLRRGWDSFAAGGAFRSLRRHTPPPLPVSALSPSDEPKA